MNRAHIDTPMIHYDFKEIFAQKIKTSYKNGHSKQNGSE